MAVFRRREGREAAGVRFLLPRTAPPGRLCTGTPPGGEEMKEGRYVALEGIDGSGTTTQARLAAEWLRGRGVDVVEAHEPTDGAVGRVIRDALSRRMPGREGVELEPELFALLFAADRQDHMSALVVPALRGGRWVISDRCYLSSFAYQSVGCDLGWVQTLNRNVRHADLILLLDLDAHTALDRVRSRALFNELDVFESAAKLAAVRESYRRVAGVLEREGERIVTIDAGGTIQAVADEVRQALAALL